jgi:hypothetical protein
MIFLNRFYVKRFDFITGNIKLRFIFYCNFLFLRYWQNNFYYLKHTVLMKDTLQLVSIILHLVPDLYIRGVTGSNISRVKGWPRWGFSWISASVYGNAGIAHKMTHGP